MEPSKARMRPIGPKRRNAQALSMLFALSAREGFALR